MLITTRCHVEPVVRKAAQTETQKKKEASMHTPGIR